MSDCQSSFSGEDKGPLHEVANLSSQHGHRVRQRQTPQRIPEKVPSLGDYGTSLQQTDDVLGS